VSVGLCELPPGCHLARVEADGTISPAPHVPVSPNMPPRAPGPHNSHTAGEGPRMCGGFKHFGTATALGLPRAARYQ